MSNGKVEEMLTQLIKVVGNIQSDLQGLRTDVQELKTDVQQLKSDVQELKTDVQQLKSDVQELKTDVQELKTEFHTMQTINEERHKEIMNQFKLLENDQDFIWEKTVRNEREIGNIKRQLS